MYKNKFGELLKKYAEESGIESGSELARMAGLSPATVTRIYTGKQKATPEIHKHPRTVEKIQSNKYIIPVRCVDLARIADQWAF